MPAGILASGSGREGFVDLHVPDWAWPVTVAVIIGLLLIDILVLNRVAHAPSLRRAALETAAWVMVGVSFGVVVIIGFGGAAGGEWFSGYLIEYSLSIDNVFVWALILAYFKVPPAYQRRVLFWGVFGALVLRAAFIFAGVALINRFEWMLFIFGGFLLYTSGRLLFTGDDPVDPSDSKFLALVNRFVRMTPELHGQRMFVRREGRRLATPLFAVLLLVEATDVLFAVDSVPAVLAVSKEQFIVFTSNAFAIMGLRSLYFMLADIHARFSYLQQGLAIILAFVGVKMIISRWYHIATPVSLLVIAIVLAASVAFSLRRTRGADTIVLVEDLQPPGEG
ncbi:MAG TPA: TerC family protein [Ilumatobacteraceae bacterium]|nr:TerC family protein [Ilumatobacteraceae bacterium]